MPGAAIWAMYPEWWTDRYEVLLDVAKRLRDDGHYEAAIVTAHTACEVCTETTLSAVFRLKGIEYLTDPLGGLISSYNLTNKKVRDVYEAVTNDRIQDQPFWPSFTEHVRRRNEVAHRGGEATQQEATDSINAAEAVVRHLLDRWR